MKYILVGFPCSGKKEIIDDLEKKGIVVGKTFNNITMDIPGVYICNSETYDNKEIINIFENESYIYLREVNNYNLPYYDGLTLESFDSSQVIALTPDQVSSTPYFPGNVCFIWLDNTATDRKTRYKLQKRDHDFGIAEEMSRSITNDFVDKIYNNNYKVMYFNNEDPIRVASIITAIIKHPELEDMFIKNFK